MKKHKTRTKKKKRGEGGGTKKEEWVKSLKITHVIKVEF
jgi:hypothetical protein